MKKIAALDLGDRHVGIALSDPLKLLARPYDTTNANNLLDYLKAFIHKENVETIIVGLPKTLKNTESEQTLKVRKQFDELALQFPECKWMVWDERLTSKQASSYKKERTAQAKKESHAIAAALILSNYLDYYNYNLSDN